MPLASELTNATPYVIPIPKEIPRFLSTPSLMLRPRFAFCRLAFGSVIPSLPSVAPLSALFHVKQFR
nr:MAG TPA: hypothetical protein [Caudoviricetes sp.]